MNPAQIDRLLASIPETIEERHRKRVLGYATTARRIDARIAVLRDDLERALRAVDDAVAKDLEEAAANGGCGLTTVELDRRPGEEAPRVTVKRIQPFEALASTARFAVELRVADPAAFGPLKALLDDQRGARGEVRARVPVPGGGEAVLLLGRDFLLDAELAGRLESLHGIAAVEFKQVETRLQAVG